jgi:hypothetical protein
MNASTALTPTDSAVMPLECPDLMRLMLGASTTFAGTYPPDLARRSRFARAENLREVDLHFTSAHKVLQGGARKQNALWVRAGIYLSAAGVLAIGICLGAAGGWWQAHSAQQASDALMPRADWRIESIAPNAVMVRIAGRLWPIRPGDQMPNGEQLLMVNDRALTIVTDTGVFKLVGTGQGASSPTPAATPSPQASEGGR